MARHSLYPGFIRIEYSANGHIHKLTLPVEPVLVGSTWTVRQVLGGGSYNPWTGAVDALVLLIKPFFHTSDTFIKADLYTVPTPTGAPSFVATYSIGVAGTSSAADIANGQCIFTWRATGGITAKLQLMEGVSGGERLPYPTGVSSQDAVFELYTSSAGFVFGRDGGIPTAPLFFTTKVNDKLRKKFLLDA